MQASDFTLPDQYGKEHSLKDYTGQWLVLYFYPKDGTSGCTKEACNFRDQRETIKALRNTEVIGVSADSVDSPYNFTLLSNPEGEIVKEYRGVNPSTHAGEIIADLRTLQAAA